MALYIEKEKIEELKELVNLFEDNIKQYKGKHYDEAKTRVDFIDKFFSLLGWDIANIQGYSEQYREVVREDRVEIKGKVKAPDYSFRIGGIRKFFVEAKKPSMREKRGQAPNTSPDVFALPWGGNFFPCQGHTSPGEPKFQKPHQQMISTVQDSGSLGGRLGKVLSPLI